MNTTRVVLTAAILGLAAPQPACNHKEEVSSPAPATAKEQSQKQRERAGRTKDTLLARNQVQNGEGDTQAARAAEADPDILLGLITEARAEALQRPQTLRRVLHYLESLVDLGPAALPAIRTFLERNEDIEYGFTTTPFYAKPKTPKVAEGDASKDTAKRKAESQGYYPQFYAMSTEYLLPPSLRLGLLEVAARIGGPESEEMLLSVLGETGRGIEVAMVDRLLEESAGDRHRDKVLAAARELLINPPKVDQPSQVDALSRRYLVGMLIKYQDEVFAQKAQPLLILENGSIDNDILTYVSQVLKERSLPMLVAAFGDPRLNQQWAGTLASYIMRHAGEDALADQFFRSAIADTKTPQLRSTVVSYLGYGTNNKESAQRRLDLLNSVKAQLTGDQQAENMVKYAEQQLQRVINPPAKGSGMEFWFQPGKGGQGSLAPGDGGVRSFSYWGGNEVQILGGGISQGGMQFHPPLGGAPLQSESAPDPSAPAGPRTFILRLGDKQYGK